MTNSRISGFYNLTIEERRAKIADDSHLAPKDLLPFNDGGLTSDAADHMIENVIGLHSLPIGIGLNFQVNSKDVLVPLVIEEPSVIAGESFMAKLVRAGVARCRRLGLLGAHAAGGGHQHGFARDDRVEAVFADGFFGIGHGGRKAG